VAVEVGTRGLHTKRVKEYLDIARKFQSPFLRLVVDDNGFEPTVKEIVQDVRSLLPVIKETGIILAMENHDRFKARQLAQIIESTDPQWVGVCLDTANSLGAGEGIEEVMQHLAPYTVNLHVKDFEVSRVPSNMGFTINGCPAGRGVIDIPGLLEHLSKNQNFYSVTLELWSDLMDDIPQTIAREHRWVARSMDYLSAVVSNFQSA
jgi:sugar phosphate isomerase/epimerase